MFRFTISDLGIFLGKSPVTIRAWERKGLISVPRVGTNRSVTVDEVRVIARDAHFRLGRISRDRVALISEALTLLGMIEMDDE